MGAGHQYCINLTPIQLREPEMELNMQSGTGHAAGELVSVQAARVSQPAQLVTIPYDTRACSEQDLLTFDSSYASSDS